MKRSDLQAFVSFASVGAIGTAVHYAVLLILVEAFEFGAVVATAAGAVAGALVNYGLNYKYTFRSRAEHRVAILKFAVTAIAGLLVSMLVVHVFVIAGVPYLLGQVVATGVVLLFGFLVNRFWTFAAGPS